MSATQTTSTELCNVITTLFTGEQVSHNQQLSRTEVYEVLLTLGRKYHQIDGGLISTFLSKTNYDNPTDRYLAKINVGKLLVVSILDMIFIYQSALDEHDYLSDRALF